MYRVKSCAILFSVSVCMSVCVCLLVRDSLLCPALKVGWSDGSGEHSMCYDVLWMVMPVMLMNSAELMTRYHGLVSSEVSNQCVIVLLFRRLCRRCDAF